MEPSSHFALLVPAGAAGVFAEDSAGQRIVDRELAQWLTGSASFAGSVGHGLILLLDCVVGVGG